MGFGRRGGMIRLVMVRPRPGPGAVRSVTMAVISPGGRRRGQRWGATEEIIIVTVVKWKLSLSLLNLVDFFL